MAPALEVADIFRRYGEAFRQEYACHLGYVERRIMGAITACRTAVLGGHVEQCDDCGAARIAYNSCRNRHCPKCQGPAIRGRDRHGHYHDLSDSDHDLRQGLRWRPGSSPVGSAIQQREQVELEHAFSPPFLHSATTLSVKVGKSLFAESRSIDIGTVHCLLAKSTG